MKDSCPQAYNVQSSGHRSAARLSLFLLKWHWEEKSIVAVQMQKLKLDVVSLLAPREPPVVPVWVPSSAPRGLDPHPGLRL